MGEVIIRWRRRESFRLLGKAGRPGGGEAIQGCGNVPVWLKCPRRGWGRSSTSSHRRVEQGERWEELAGAEYWCEAHEDAKAATYL
ncbi:hypothetical protein N7455_002693 [Penicillium solitum]|uniref:uncharacterized protein n=1 Tax=Penicillium solitum TaxID=60172 RepID=UPI0032C3DD17|nr:hypothetical protein N7455_002693 [Penicillium solitum]